MRALEQPLLVLRRVVLEVLGEVAELARALDRLGRGLARAGPRAPRARPRARLAAPASGARSLGSFTCKANRRRGLRMASSTESCTRRGLITLPHDRPRDREKEEMVATDLERFVEADGRADRRQGGPAAGSTPRASPTSTTSSSRSPAGSWARAFPRPTGRRSRRRASSSSTGRRRTSSSTATATTSATARRRGSSSASRSPRRFEVLPWDSRVARVWCTCFRNREDRDGPGEVLTSDCRGNLRRIQEELEGADRACTCAPAWSPR